MWPDQIAQVAVKGGEVLIDEVSKRRADNHSAHKIADIVSDVDGIAFQKTFVAFKSAAEFLMK